MADAKDLASAHSNMKVQDNLRDGLHYPYTEQYGADYISSMLSTKETFTGWLLSWAYYIAEEYWGRGILTEIVKKTCKHVFEKSDIIRIYEEPFAYNAASCRVLEKAGFQYEDTLRNNAIENGKIIDMKMHSLLKAEL